MEREEYEEVEGGLVKWGGFGTVRPVKRKSDGNTLACKRISFDRDRYGTQANFKERVEREIHLLKCLDHPNVVRYCDIEWVSEDDEVKIYTEYLQDQNLDYYISQNYNKPNWPSEREAWSLICQLSAALAYCHHGQIRIQGTRAASMVVVQSETSIWHRDIKPDNVLVHCKSSGQAVFKLCDFGLGVVRSPKDMKQLSFGGTCPFIAPEVTKDNPDWSNKADIFALGCTFYYCYKREPPWRYHLTNASSATVPSLPKHAPQSIKDLIYSCIAFDAQDRPEADKLFRDALEHLDEEDRALASIKTFHTISNTRPQNWILQSSGQPGSAATPKALTPLIQVGQSGSLPKQNTSRSVAASRAPLETVPKNLAAESQVQRPPGSMPGPLDAALAPRQSVDSFYSLQNTPTRPNTAPIPTAPAAPSSSDKASPQSKRPKLSSSGPGRRLEGSSTSTWTSAASRSMFTNREIGSGDVGEIGEWIGSLVVDYKRYPPVDMFTAALPGKKIMRVVLGTDLKFRSTYVATDPPRKRSRFSLLGTAWGGMSTKVDVAIEADRCEEYLLENSEGYVDRWVSDGNPRKWIARKNDQNKRFYVVVGYIVYLNARVQEAAAGEGFPGGSSMSFASLAVPVVDTIAGASVGIEPGLSANSMGSNTFDKTYAKRGYQIQAVSVREVLMSKSGLPSLGEVEPAYFWGPRTRPFNT